MRDRKIESKTDEHCNASISNTNENSKTDEDDHKVINEIEDDNKKADNEDIQITPTDNEDVMEYTIEPNDATIQQ